MIVSELIELLKTQRQDLEVIYDIYSESALLEEKNIFEVEACLPRPDGWVANKRPDAPYKTYLRLP